MAIIIGAFLFVGLGLLIFGAMTGRVRMNQCCSVADPRRDLRMRAAFEDDPE